MIETEDLDVGIADQQEKLVATRSKMPSHSRPPWM